MGNHCQWPAALNHRCRRTISTRLLFHRRHFASGLPAPRLEGAQLRKGFTLTRVPPNI